VNNNGVIEFLRESHEQVIIVDHLTDYDEVYEALRNVFWDCFLYIVLDNTIKVE